MRSSRGWSTRAFASLANPNYARFFAGQALSLIGTWMQSVALAWLVLQLTGSASSLGIAVALQTLPILLLGPYGGLVVDRVDKRRLLILTQALSGVQALVLAILVMHGDASYPIVLALTLSLGLINAFDQPARLSFVREMVAAEEVRNAVSLNAVLMNAARSIGPGIGGVLIATSGVAACFLANAVSFLAAIIAYLSMNRALLHRGTPTPRAPRQLRDGFSYVRRTPVLLVPLTMMAIIGTLTFEFAVTLPALATQTFDGDASSIGLLTSAMGVGAIVGGLTSATQTRVSPGTLVGSALGFSIGVLLTAIAPNIALASLALVIVGIASAWFMAAGNTTLQLHSNPQMRGRVMALWSVAFIGSTPIGGPIVGFIAEQANARWALGVGAVAAAVAALIGVLARRQFVASHGHVAT